MRILVVDDEEDLCIIVKHSLENEGFTVDFMQSSNEVIKADLSIYKLLILDVMLDNLSGFDIARKLKSEKKYSDIPIIFITAKESENDILTGFSSGADDYITKPFSLKELNARVKAVIKRSYNGLEESLFVFNDAFISYKDFKIDLNKKLIFIGDRCIKPTKREYEFLILIFKSPDEIFSREKLTELLIPENSYVTLRSVDVSISRLRSKLGEYSSLIGSRSGFGYFLNLT